jgi:hypothetical protein
VVAVVERVMVDATLDTMIRQRIGAQRYGLFFSVGEGSFYPDGSEESSGTIVAEDGCHYSYWTDWDYVQGCQIFAIWRQINPQNDWRQNVEYRDARRDAGLTTADRPPH